VISVAAGSVQLSMATGLADVSVPKREPRRFVGASQALVGNTQSRNYLAAFYPALSIGNSRNENYPAKRRRPADVAAFRHLAGPQPEKRPQRLAQLGDPAKHRDAQSRHTPARQRGNALRVLRPTALLETYRIPSSAHQGHEASAPPFWCHSLSKPASRVK
jgi:hypothetical protein